MNTTTTLSPLPTNTSGVPTLPPFTTPLPTSGVTTRPPMMTGSPTGAPVKLGDKQRMGMSTVEKITIALAIAICIVLTGLIAAMSSRSQPVM